MNIFHRKRQRLYAKLETVIGTYVGDAALFALANGTIPVYDLRVAPVALEQERTPDGLTFDSIDSVRYGEYATFTFKTDLFTAGALGVAPAHSPLFKAAACKETIVATTSCTYTPDSNSAVNIDLGAEFISDDGTATLKFAIAGAMGTFELTTDAIGKVPQISWTFIGKVAYVTSTPQYVSGTQVSSVVYIDSVANQCRFAGTAIAIGGVNRQVSTFKFDRGHKQAFFTDNVDATGYGGSYTDSQKPIVTLNPSKVPVATQNDIAGLIGSTGVALSATFGSVSTKKVIITAPRATRKTVGDGAQGNTSTFDIAFNLHRSVPTGNGEDAFSIQFV